MVLGATIIGTTKIPEAIASSSNPLAYLVGLLLIGLAFIARQVWKDMKKSEQRLIELDEQHRIESKEREQKLNDQLSSSIEASKAIVDTQKEMVTAITSVKDNLNTLEKNVGKRLDDLEKIVQKERA